MHLSHCWRHALFLGAALALSFCAAADNVELKPGELQWKPLASMVAGAQIALLYGEPGKTGPYAYRIKFPPNYRVMPHFHADDRTYTFLSGTFYEADGSKFDEARLKPFPPGSFATYTANSHHFGMTRGEEVIFQVSGMAPTGLSYVDPADDPRKK